MSDALGFKSGQFISNVERGLCSIPIKRICDVAVAYETTEQSVIDAMVEDYKDRLLTASYSQAGVACPIL